MSRRVYHLCGFLSKTLKQENENPLYSLGLRDFVIVLTFIAGMFRNIAWATGSPSKSIKLPTNDLHELYGQAYSVFENWPHNFHQFLSKQSRGRIRLNPDDGKLGTVLKKEFGSFYEHLYQDLDEPQFDFMREAFAQFLTDLLHSVCQPAEGISFAPTAAPGKYISLYDARRLLKITNKALFDLITDGEIRCVITNGRRNPEYKLNLSDIEGLKCEFEQSITSRDLAKQLGIEIQLVMEATGSQSTFAAVVDSMLRTRDPFPIVNTQNLLSRSSDSRTRAHLFVSNLQLLPGESASAVSVEAIDSANNVYSLAVEDVRSVPNTILSQVTVCLHENLPNGRITIRVALHGQVTNSGTIMIQR